MSVAPIRHGTSLVELLVVLALIGVLFGMALPAVQNARESARRAKCQNNLKQSAVALHAYHAARQSLPAGRTNFQNLFSHRPGYLEFHGDKLFASWEVAILPYIELGTLYDKVLHAVDHATSPYPPESLEIERTLIPLFLCPGNRERGAGGGVFASYLGVAGVSGAIADGVFFFESQTRLTSISDGTSQTLLIGERPTALDGSSLGTWMSQATNSRYQGVDYLGVRERAITINGIDCLESVAHYKPYPLPVSCGWFAFWSTHPNGANWAFADGSVRFLAYSADPILPALSTRAGGEVVGDY